MFEADSSSSCVSSSSPLQVAEASTGRPNQSETKTQCGDIGESILQKETQQIPEPPPEQSNKLSSTRPEISKTNLQKKICGVCGDTAKSFHFGGLSCDSCKAFFRRSVHNDSYAAFHCAYDSHCVVDKTSRKGCQFCRFQKCLTIGMEKKWVMGEEERNQLKQKKDKKDVVVVEKIVEPPYEPNVAEMLNYMSAEEKDEIECIVNKYQHSYKEIPFRVSYCQGSRNTIEIIQMFTTILRRFAYFTKLLPEFTELSLTDQSTLLRASVLEMCLLRGALSFDLKNNRWPKTERMEFLKDCPQLRVEDMEKLVSKDLYDMHMQFIKGIQELGADEPTVMLLLQVVLFYPERGSLENQNYISQVQEKYLLLLRKYVQWRYGPTGTKTFPKLLTKLADLRQLNDSHTEYNLRMTQTEVERIQEQLGNLNLNPYPQWVLVEDQLNVQQGNQQYHHPEQSQGYTQEYQQQQLPQQYPPNYVQQQQQVQTPQAKDFFKQFVNRKIPALVSNPFASFPIESELAYARSFFQQPPTTATSSPESVEMSNIGQSQTSDGTMSQFKDILESSDPNVLRQIKDSLSPDVLAKLQGVFGTEAGGFDRSKIPPELMNSFMQQQNIYQTYASSGQTSQPQGMGVNNGSGFQAHHDFHPMAQFSQSQLSDHFTNLQQQFRNPNYYETQEMAYFQGTNNYGPQYHQPHYNYPQPQHQHYPNY